ncbi:hypothetical protein TI01_2151 [Lysobacter sp. A03]|nr:hypothetical protein TI01_2151 [Lysobacter sp. A03]
MRAAGRGEGQEISSLILSSRTVFSATGWLEKSDVRPQRHPVVSRL